MSPIKTTNSLLREHAVNGNKKQICVIFQVLNLVSY